MKRRTLLRSLPLASAGTSLPAFLMGAGAESAASPRGRADACIFIWLGGGAAQIDTWDPKRLGDPAKRVAGSAYPSIATAVPGVEVCSHLGRVADRLDRMTILRSVHHEVIDEHAAATNRVHTGRPVSGTVVYPSIGSVIQHELGAALEGVPGYVLMGYPSVSRGPGFLGARHGYLYLLDTTSGPAGLKAPASITPGRQARREALLGVVRDTGIAGRLAEDPLLQYDAVLDESQRLAGGPFGRVFDLADESPELRSRYGGEFGQRCLLARRLVEAGTRFVEVTHNLNFSNGTGWDTHNQGQLNQHVLIGELDEALAALCDDLEARNRLDRTLIVVASEFGRPAAFDSGGGRGHQSTAFSVVLAGGGLRHRGVLGETDELSKLPVTRPVSIPDLHATIYATLGLDPAKELHDGDRPVPITDRGKVVAELF